MQKKKVSSVADSYVCINGEVLPSQEAKVSIWDRGLIYGDGFFTTMRAEKGKVFFLKEHMQRLKNSCASFRIEFPELLHNNELYTKILKLNRLVDLVAVVKVIITRGKEENLGLPYGKHPTYIMMAKSYEPPYEKYQKGWHLISFPTPRSCMLSAHKSLNYLYNMWAKEYALKKGADEAILIGADGLVKETSVGSLVFQKQGNWFTPDGNDILPGITLKMLSHIWSIKEGISIERRATFFEDLINADQVWVLNSLVGIIPVSRINGHKLKSGDDWEFANRSRRWLWNYAIYGCF